VLIARGKKEIGAASLSWALAFGPRFWSVVVERRGMVLDSRFTPASVDPARPRSCIYLLLHGTWVAHAEGAEKFDGPAAFLVTEEQLEGAAGVRPFTFAAKGDPFRAIEFHVHDADLRVAHDRSPLRVTLSEAVWASAEEVVRLSEHDDASFQKTFSALVDGLAREILAPKTFAPATRTSRAFTLLWGALRPMIERLYLTPTLQEVVEITGVSIRQMDRYIQSFVTTFGLVGERWRTTTLHLRLKLAVILLSADGASVGAVASAVGYGSSDAMSRAFRDAGLRAPSVLREEIRRAHTT
jgi:AraC-like DNA-binding protein